MWGGNHTKRCERFTDLVNASFTLYENTKDRFRKFQMWNKVSYNWSYCVDIIWFEVCVPMDDLAPFRTALAIFSSPTISSSPGKCSSERFDLSCIWNGHVKLFSLCVGMRNHDEHSHSSHLSGWDTCTIIPSTGHQKSEIHIHRNDCTKKLNKWV